MSLLDTLGSLLGSQSQQQGGGQAQLLAAAMEFVNNQPGGLNGLIEKFQQGGLGEIVQSWVGNGENQSVSPDQLHSVLGSDVVSGLAQKVGMQPEQVSGLLAQVLPVGMVLSGFGALTVACGIIALALPAMRGA